MIFAKSHGFSVPALGFGTFRMKGDECARAVESALHVGFRHLDTAEIYDNEAAVAQGVAAAGIARGDLFITTKAWMDDMSPAGLRKSLDASLKALRTEYVDLWLIHWPNPKFEVEEILAVMQKEVDAGRVRALGVSNFPVALFERAARAAPILCNQVEYHPYLAQDKVIAAARKHGALVMAFAPLGIGKVRDDPVLAGIGAKYKKSAAQVVLRWFVQQPGVGAIPKASSREHCAKNFDIFDFALTDQEMKTVHGLARGERMIQPDFGPQWDS
jgi:2,5-diketo-D-gluconate reductase B